VVDEAPFVTTFQHIAPETSLNSGELVSSLLFNSNLWYTLYDRVDTARRNMLASAATKKRI